MTPNSFLIILLTAVWVSVTTLSAATTNAAASIGPSVAGQVPVYTDTTGQIMTPSSSLTDVTLVTPTITVPGGYYHGAVLTPWVSTNNSISLQWRKSPQVWEFVGNSIPDWTAMTANSGSATLPNTSSDAIEQGAASFTTGTVTNGAAGIRGGVALILFTTNTQAVLWRIKTPSALSSDAEGYELYYGLGDSSGNAAPGDGAYFYYLHSVSNGVWCAKTVNNTSSTFASGAPTTPPAVTVDTWYNLLLEGNSSAVNFWVSSNDSATWQWIGYSTSNIPIAIGGTQTGLQAYIRKVGGSVGTTARVSYAGRCEFWPNRAN